MSMGSCVICKSPATFQCSACHSTPYCGKQHQKDDWPKHKASCRSFQIKTDDDGNFFVVATRKIKEGEVIVDEVPLVIGPNYLNHADDVCVGCHQLNNVQRCPSCDWPACSSKCPGLKDVTRHGAECVVLSKVKPWAIHSTEVILPLRCLMLQQTDPKKWKVFQKMADRAVALAITNSSNEVKYILQESILKPLAKVAPGLLPDCSENTLRWVLSVLEVYSVDMTAPQYAQMDVVCGVTSLMEHSCLPNTRRLVDIPPLDIRRPTETKLRCRIVTRATRDIAKGERISTVFMDTWMCSWARQHSLASRRQTYCGCRRCLDPTELGTHFGTLRCTSGPCTGFVLSVDPLRITVSDWKCQKCGKMYDYLHVTNLMTTLKDQMTSCRVREAQGIQKYEEMLKRLQKFLHPSHHFCTLIKERLYGMYGRLLMSEEKRMLNIAQLEKVEELCREVLSLMINPAIITPTPRTHECLMILSAVTIEIAHRKKASGEWNSARFEKAQNDSRQMIAAAVRQRHTLFDERSAGERLPIDQLQKFAVSLMSLQMGMF